MKTITFVMLFVIIGSVIVHGQTVDQALKPDAKAEQELRGLRRDLMEALRLGDRVALERILANGFTFVHSTGGAETRKEYIDRAIANARTSQATQIEFTDEQLRIYEGRTAIWVTRSIGRDKVAGTETNFRGTDVIVKIEGRWQWASVHSTRLPSRPKAATSAHSLYKAYIGQYEIAPGRTLTVTEESETLRGLVTGFRPAELIPKSETEFVWFNPDSNVEAQIIFIRDDSGRVTYAAFRREGAEVWRAKKI